VLANRGTAVITARKFIPLPKAQYQPNVRMAFKLATESGPNPITNTNSGTTLVGMFKGWPINLCAYPSR
jgi:hypothetical protein